MTLRNGHIRTLFRTIRSRIMDGQSFSNTCSLRAHSNLIAVCQMTATNDKDNNYEVVEKLVEEAKNSNAKIVFLPEACDFVGTSKNETLSLAEPLDGPLVTKYKNLAKKLKIWLSLGGIHELQPNAKVFNTHLMIDDSGDIVGKYHKIHLFDVDIPEQKIRLMESSYVEKGEFIAAPVSTPVGKVGLSICYDIRFPELSLCLAKMGAEILTYPSAFTFATGASHWETLLKARAVETQCYIVAAAQVGAHNSKRTSWGHALVVNPWGDIIAQCSEGTGLMTAPIDTDYIKKVQLHMPVRDHRRIDLYPEMITKSVEHQQPKKEFYAFGQVNISRDTIFYKTELSYAFTNKKCVLPGHVLVAPIREAIFYADLTSEEVADLFKVAQKVSKAMSKIHSTTSSTIVIQDGPEAGQSIKHVHVHILPRKSGDFERNDDIYIQLRDHDKRENIKWRSEDEMRIEAEQIKKIINDIQ